MAKALGMIETRGLIGSIVAADAMLKSADVRLVKQEKVDAALVTVLVEGDVSAVQAAVDMGKEEAARVGELVSAHVIPHPDEEVGNSLLKDENKELQSKETPKDNKATKKSSAAKTKSSIQYKAKADSAAVEEDQKVE
ncbi:MULTISPECIES: BMC domain-containing protein [Priestia]|jgi:ethanolamine utilization protein EutM|uniref:Ethanolamine utilization protein n=1 Tax=Priestia megaterium (strain ATCC 12872 / QMB1551) TaxID=545693 RepID=D5E1V8_PRIM1|nr:MULTISPECIES: BMC domain-containing protein [Priestia]AVX09602.1 BMC domain-containing protein [Bacillus sp. Y-01]KQU12907.1 ethanolamine utilization protein [Bacillus sp. Leaf75]MBZ5481255.1 BMC domain-containing protein [Bacillus sp. T_4]MCJ7985183.1 BMC domain-containing protein [Priestia sp. OVL9]MDH6653331.1 microcompartment protein CcmL/EutN [Bacillus sp. PvP124]MDP9576568.1 microcompartment protein CcmL/EutN [Bacillus sp. 1751]